jgi:hypothetical protein
VQRLHEAFRSALFHPRHLAELARYDQAPAYLGPADYARALAQAYEQERRLAERQALPGPEARPPCRPPPLPATPPATRPGAAT